MPKLAATAALLFLSLSLAAQPSAAEYELYNNVIKDIAARNSSQALLDLDTWKQKFPESNYQNERVTFYVQCYAATDQPAKTVDAAAELIGKDLAVLFPDTAQQATIIRLLYNTAWAIARIPNPSPEEVATGAKAARLLMDYDKPLPGVSEAQWAEARADMRQKAAAALLYLDMLPGLQAMAKQPPDCAAAEGAYAKALGDYPDKSVLSYEMGRALRCLSKLSPAVYAFERAAVLDPTLGDPKNDARKIQSFADDSYVKLHGNSDGLAQLKDLVKESPLPPDGFHIQTAAEIAQEKEAEFEKTNPQLALWMKIKAALAADNGESYFESELKNSAVPQLTGTLVKADSSCHPSTLLVAVLLPDAHPPFRAEITLKLAKPLAGRPELNDAIRWEGVPTAFTREPFMLTMDTGQSRIQGLKTTPCPVKKQASRQGVISAPSR